MPWTDSRDYLQIIVALLNERTGNPVRLQWRKERPSNMYEPGVRVLSPEGKHLTGYMNEGRMIEELTKMLRIVGVPAEDIPAQWNPDEDGN